MATFAAGLATASFSTAQAQTQYYYYPYYPACSPFPLTWPFCAAGAIVGTAADIATAPIWLFSGSPPPFYPPRYYAPGPVYYAPPSPPAYYYPPPH